MIESDRVSRSQLRVFGIVILVLAAFLIWALLVLYPSPAAGVQPFVSPLTLLELVLVTGALGGWLATALELPRSIDRGVSEGKLWSACLRVPIGAVLALLLHFALRAALLRTPSDSAQLNVMGICGMSGLIGVFSGQVVKRLEVLVDGWFAPPGRAS